MADHFPNGLIDHEFTALACDCSPSHVIDDWLMRADWTLQDCAELAASRVFIEIEH